MERILPSNREWPLFSVAATRAIEARAIESQAAETQAVASPQSGSLMRRAGESVARLALAVAPHSARVWIAAGPGNNGGDGLEAAVHLAAAGRHVEVGLLADPIALPADAKAAYERATAAGVVIHVKSNPSEWPVANERGGLGRTALGPNDIGIDALLGIGSSRAPSGALAAAVRWLNSQRCAVIAVDVPSGLNSDTGQAFGDDCVNARHTLAMLTLKPGLFTGSGRDHTGEVWLDELDIENLTDTPTAMLSASVPAASAPRRHAQHKGSFGDVAMVGGAPGMTGAALLAGRAAHAAGAGRVFIHLLQSGPGTLAADLLRPELMFRGHDLLEDTAHLGRSTVVCGCGGGDAVRAVLPRLLSAAGRLVLDADALNALAADASLAALLVARAARGRPSVLTPHPLEAARLLGLSTAELQADRLVAAARLAERFRCTIVLKGSGTVIAAPGHAPNINASGNASLATGGTGDVLAGWLGGLWAQSSDGHDGFAVAVRAVAQHGAAADPEVAGSMRAGDLIEALHRRQR